MSVTTLAGGRKAQLIVLALIALALVVGAADAFAQNPFGAPKGAPPPAPPPTGITGWLLAKQAEFYRLLSGAIRRIVPAVDPIVPVVALRPVREYIDGQFARPRFGVLCAVVLGVVALTLASFGTFAVLSLLVAQRTKEIGIRVALGAAPRQVQRLVLRDSLIPAVVGCVVGTTAAAWLTRAIVDQLFGVSALDPVTFTLAPILLIAVAAAASWWPARRAMRVNPTQALRA